MTSLQNWIGAYGIKIHDQPMGLDHPAQFDGTSIALNPLHAIDARCFYLVHSFGSIVGWSLQFERVASIFEGLRHAKLRAREDPDRFASALDAFRAFEEQSSEYAVWVLQTVGHPRHIDEFTVFFRADLEAITLYHRVGRGPDWPSFLAQWKADVASGRRRMTPFRPRAVPPFTPLRIETQEVVQQHDNLMPSSSVTARQDE